MSPKWVKTYPDTRRTTPEKKIQIYLFFFHKMHVFHPKIVSLTIKKICFMFLSGSFNSLTVRLKKGMKHVKVKTTFLFTLTLLIVSSVGIRPGFTQDMAYTQLSLPEGAKARLGKGSVGEVTYSPGGALLAVGSNIGIWLYDAKTFQELAFLPRTDGLDLTVYHSARMARRLPVAVEIWTVRFVYGILRQVQSPKRTLTGHMSGVRSLSFSPDGTDTCKWEFG